MVQDENDGTVENKEEDKQNIVLNENDCPVETEEKVKNHVENKDEDKRDEVQDDKVEVERHVPVDNKEREMVQDDDKKNCSIEKKEDSEQKIIQDENDCFVENNDADNRKVVQNDSAVKNKEQLMVQKEEDSPVESKEDNKQILAQDENDRNVENKAEDKIEDRLRSMMESAMQSTEKIGKISEETISKFVNRLSSFSPLTYFGKPSCLSPLVCARLGWRNAEKDLLVCSSCHAALAITLLPGLSPESKEKICQVYREKLATCHKANCPFHVEGKEFLRNQEDDEEVIPFYIVDTFPSECVELVEHPRPSALLQSRVKRLEECCPSGYKFPVLEVQESERKEIDSAQTSLASQLQTNDSVAILALLGWEPMEEEKRAPDEVSPLTLALGCQFCYSQMELALEKEQHDEQEEATPEGPPAKKTRLSRHYAPLDAHRHYCPLVCGFPTQPFAPKKPIWKIIFSHLQKESVEVANLPMPNEETKMTEEDYDKTVYRINEILDAAIAPVDLRVDDGIFY